MNGFLKYDFFTAHECFSSIFEGKKHLIDPDGYRIDSETEEFGGFGIMSSVMGCIPNHPFISEILDFYNNLLPNSCGEYPNYIIDRVLALKLERYGYRYIDERQQLSNGVTIFTTDLFWTQKRLFVRNGILFHECMNSWNQSHLKSLMTKIKLKVYQFSWRLQEFLINS